MVKRGAGPKPGGGLKSPTPPEQSFPGLAWGGTSVPRRGFALPDLISERFVARASCSCRSASSGKLSLVRERNRGSLLAAVVLFLCPHALLPQSLAGVKVLTPEAAQWEKVEIALVPDRVPNNPFDPNEVTLDALITLPSGKQVKVPGFWFQSYQRSIQNPSAAAVDRIEVLAPDGKPEWRVRFSSGETGRRRVVLDLKERGSTRRSTVQSFTVKPGGRGGVIRISPRNRQYLEDQSGRVFFPIGENLCMYQNKEGTYYFDRLLGKLSENGGNYVRLWQEYYVNQKMKVTGAGDGSFTGFPLETQVTGLGRYDLPSAWRLDYVSQLCERLNVRWQISFEMVVWWEEKLAYRWGRNPYNAANGGPCVKPADYFVNPKARELVKRRLRYSVARWGWTTNLAAWELWNEVDNMDDFNSDRCANWHREMGQYLKQIDPWRHLVTTMRRNTRCRIPTT